MTSPDSDGDAPDEFNLQAVEAAIAALEAQYGMTREQLMADQSELGRAYRLLQAQAARAAKQAVEDVQTGAQERGILRSGITAEGIAESQRNFAELSSDLTAQEASALASIQTALSQAESSTAAAQLQAAIDRGLQVLTLEELEALLDVGLA